MSIKILACDSSKNQTGFCVATVHELKTGVEVVYSTEVFKAKGETDAEVLLNWGQYFKQSIGIVEPDLIVFELPVIAQVTNMICYQVAGVLQYVAASRNVKILPVHNATLRSWHGAAKKPVAEARELLGLKPDAKLSDDESDAAFLAMIGCAYLRLDSVLTDTDTKKIDTIARLMLTKAERASAASAAKIAAGQKEQARQDSKATRERAQEARRVARELRDTETLRKRTEGAQRRAEKAGKK